MIVLGDSDIIVFERELVFSLQILHELVVVLYDQLVVVVLEGVEADLSTAGVPADYPCHLVLLDEVALYFELVVVDQHDAVGLVALYGVLLDVDDRGRAQDAVEVLVDVVLGDEELLAVDHEDAMTPCALDLVVIDVVVDVTGSFQYDVAVDAALDDVLLDEGSGVGGDVDAVADVGGDLVEEDMRVGTALHAYAKLVVVLDGVAGDD